MRRIRDIDLMQLADGELDPATSAELEAAVAADPEQVKKVEGIAEIGELVRGEAELAADEAEPKLGRMWAEIEKRMLLDREAEKAPPVRAAGPGFWGRVSTWVDHYRGHVLTGVLSAGAVAAIALVMRPAPRVASDDRTAVKNDAPPPVTMPVVSPTPAPVELEAVEAPDGTSTVFTYETEDGEETTVIWVTPDDVEEL